MVHHCWSVYDSPLLAVWILMVHYWRPTLDSSQLITNCWQSWIIKSWQYNSQWLTIVGQFMTVHSWQIWIIKSWQFKSWLSTIVIVHCWSSTVNDPELTDLNYQLDYVWRKSWAFQKKIVHSFSKYWML